jgi:putative glutamine amidotransferase
MTNNRPLIGITTDLKDKYYGIEAAYSIRVAAAGGAPVLIPSNNRDKNTLREYSKRIDGLLIPGSRDMDPKYYNQKPHKKLNPMNEERTISEYIVVEESIKNNVPVLGICGGMQFINVFFGGSLYQDIKSLIPSALNHENGVTHEISIAKDSQLKTVFKKSKIKVNSYHHQAIKKVGKGLIVSAYSNDNLVEALESEGKSIIAVQWHPELTGDIYSKELFKHFINKALSMSRNN